MLKIACGTVMIWKWVVIKMHDAFRKVYGDNYVLLGVSNLPWIALQPVLPVCSLGRTANENHWHARS